MPSPFVLPPPSLPTPVRACESLGGKRARLWLKHDGVTHAVYGGNKVRKIGRLLAEAERRQAKRLLTFGAAGSHYLLATTLFARSRGLAVAAVVMPQEPTPHVLDTFRATLALGPDVRLVAHALDVPQAVLELHRPGDYIVPPGGSNRVGAQGYADAVDELVEQIQRGELPEPDLIVVPLGSGGTAAGLVAGVVRHGLKSRVVGVLITKNPLAGPLVRRLARQVLGSRGRAKARELAAHFELDRTELGAGYGRATPGAILAQQVAHDALGLELDLTYTAKAFAAVLARLGRDEASGVVSNVLYWHTLSSVTLEPLLVAAPSRADALEQLSALV